MQKTRTLEIILVDSVNKIKNIKQFIKQDVLTISTRFNSVRLTMTTIKKASYIGCNDQIATIDTCAKGNDAGCQGSNVTAAINLK